MDTDYFSKKRKVSALFKLWQQFKEMWGYFCCQNQTENNQWFQIKWKLIALYNDRILLLMKIYSLDSICVLHILLPKHFSDIKKYIMFFCNKYILLLCYWCKKIKKRSQHCQLQHLIQYASMQLVELILQTYWISEHPQVNLKLMATDVWHYRKLKVSQVHSLIQRFLVITFFLSNLY